MRLANSAPLCFIMLLSACATPRMHSTDELNSAGLACGLSYGELIQDEEEKKLLIALKSNISAKQRACVTQWAKSNHLRAVFVHIEMPDS